MADGEVHSDFRSIDWCMDLINSPSTCTIPWPSRPEIPPADNSCSLFARTLHTPSGVRAVHPLWETDTSGGRTEQALLLVSMGDGLNYYRNTLHGGMVAALADEAMGVFIMRKMGWASGSNTFTVKIDLTLRGKIVTPGVCLVRAWADDQDAEKQGKAWAESRKLWGLATIEDGQGRTLVEARYMFIQRDRAAKL